MTEDDQLNPAWWPRFWRSPPLLALCGLLAVSFFWTIHWMTIRWDEVNSYYSHGWLIAPIALALIYRKRKLLAAARVRPCRWGLAILIPSLLLHVLGTAWQVGFLSGFALIGVLIGLVLALFGPQVLRTVLFPLVFLAFMVPLPVLLVESVSFRLKLLAARFAVGALDVVGLPAVREGSYIHIPTGTVVVEDVCSGLKYLISLMAFGALYAHISSVSKLQKAILFLISAPISFAANVMRVTLMVLIGYFWGIPATEKWYLHGVFGFVLFAVAFAMLFATEALFMRGRRRRRADEAPTLSVVAAGPAARPAARYGRV
jgi:exosortase A